jgi:hypothetical protein
MKFIETKIKMIKIEVCPLIYLLSYKPIIIPEANPKVWAIKSELLLKSLNRTISSIIKLKYIVDFFLLRKN